MKLFAFCLFAACLGSLAMPTSREKRKLMELLDQLDRFNKTLKTTERNIELPTPPKNIEDCCSVPALECFADNLDIHFNKSQEHQKVIKSLKHSHTKKGLTFKDCTHVTTSCKDCASHPKERADEFLKRLESLIQKGISW